MAVSLCQDTTIVTDKTPSNSFVRHASKVSRLISMKIFLHFFRCEKSENHDLHQAKLMNLPKKEKKPSYKKKND